MDLLCLYLGAMVFGCIFAGGIAKKFGRKLPLTFLSIPSIVSINQIH